MRVRESTWAATSPWTGLQGVPLFLQNPAGIPVSAIIGLEPGETPGDFATVAYSGQYADLLGKPTLGSAAFASLSTLATSAQGALADTALQPAQSDVFQSGSVDIVAATQSYAVVFVTPMAATPDIVLQLHIDDVAGEFFILAVQDDVTDGNGFTFRLGSVPVGSVGRVTWQARVY